MVTFSFSFSMVDIFMVNFNIEQFLGGLVCGGVYKTAKVCNSNSDHVMLKYDSYKVSY